MFERKIIRTIYGPVIENNVWRIRYNEEINTLLKGKDIVRFIKSQRIRWLGDVERMEDNAMSKRMLKGRLYSKRTKGRPRMRWLDDVESDLKMKVKGWKEKMRDREQQVSILIFSKEYSLFLKRFPSKAPYCNGSCYIRSSF
jgi:hypothetical protein